MQIFVLGMHRSGTSVVTRLINLMGAYFGPEELSTGANPENPKGFWERRDIRDENDALLWSASADWWKIANFSLDKIPDAARNRFDSNAPTIVRELNAHLPWVLKEPRFCLLFPMWRRLVETPVCVLVHRSPIQVAFSLEDRNGFPLSFGTALWERYVLDSLSASAEFPRILVSYEQIMADPVGQVDQLFRDLTNAGVSGLSRLSKADIESFVCADLFRHRHSEEKMLELLNPAQIDLANSMASGAALNRGEAPALSMQARNTLRLYEEVCAPRGPVNASKTASREPSGDSEQAWRGLADFESDPAAPGLEPDTEFGRSNVLRPDLARAQAERNDLLGRFLAQQQEVESLRTFLDETKQALDRARRTTRSKTQKVERVQNELDSAVERVEQLEARVTALDAIEEARDLENARASELESAVERLQTELASWRDEIGIAESRQRELEKWSETLLLFLRRSQSYSDDARSARIWQVGPLEFSSRRQADVMRNRLAGLFREVSQWVKNHRDELIAIVGPDPSPSNTPHPPADASFAQPPTALNGLVEDGKSRSRGRGIELEQSSRSPVRRESPAATGLSASARESTTTACKRRKWVVYTAVTAGYDRLKAPLHVSPFVDYVCFTDREIEDHNVWQLRYVDYLNADPTRTARFVKVHPHIYLSEYDKSLWMDANLLLKDDPEKIFDVSTDLPATAFIHPHRDCIYDEAREVILRGGLDDKATVLSQMGRFREEGFPEHFGLAETNVLIRQHNEQSVKDLMSLWWAEIANGSRRDQLSFTFALWRSGQSFNPLAPFGISVRNDPRFERFLHGDESTHRSTPQSKAHLDRNLETELVQDAFGRIGDGTDWAASNLPDLDSLSLDVIVCVHDSLNEVRRCLSSIISTSKSHHGLIIVDDGSGEETAEFLRGFAANYNNVKLIRRENAGGYTKAVNCGIGGSTADFVILLNSDTVVPKEWWRKLARTAYENAHTGIVGPLSNAASWQSVPDILDENGQLAVNKRPAAFTVEDMDRIAETCSTATFPRVDLANGFCLGVRRAVFDTIGAFDERSFPRGYGEENDFCFRAVDAGFGIVIATDCYVFHEKSKSYTATRRDELALEGSKALRQMYTASRIGNAVESCKKNPILVGVRKRFRKRLEETVRTYERKRHRRLGLQTIDQVSGGTLPSVSRQPGFFDLPDQLADSNKKIVTSYLEGPRPIPERILWFVPAFSSILRGGIRTIFSVAEDFSRCWGSKNLFALYGQLSETDTDIVRESIAEYFPDLKYDIFAVKNGQDPSTLPESDIAFCTLWTSAYLLAKYNNCAGKFYFVQDFEPSFYRAGTTYAFVEGTYRLGFPVIANSLGVAQEVRRRCETVGFFTPGLDRSVFHPRDNETNCDVQRVVFYGRPGNPRNAFELGVDALREVKRSLGDRVQIVSVGADFDPRDYGLHGVIENWGVLNSIKEVADLYRSSSVGLVFMFSAHPSYQPLEFMGCGCATVTNWNPSTTWLLKHRHNALLVDPMTSPVANAIISLLEDQKLRSLITENGLETVRRIKWEEAYSRVREFVLHPCEHAIPAPSIDYSEAPPAPPRSESPSR